MGFELPSALFGLLLVSAPLIAHLVRQRELPTATLPTLRFLSHAIAESRQRHRFTNLLLLVLRMAIIALAVLGLSAPYTMVPMIDGDGRRTALALVVDDSRSMMAIGEDGRSLLAEAIAQSRRAVSSLPDGSTVTVVLSGAPPRTIVRNESDFATVTAGLGAIPLETGRRGQLASAVATAVQSLNRAPPGVRRLIVFSDFADHERPEEIRWPSEGIAAEAVWLRPSSQVNRRVFAIERSLDPNDPERLLIRAQVLSDGSEPSIAVRLESASGSQVDEREATLAEGSGTVSLSASAETDGNPLGTLRIEGQDALPIDDRAEVVLRAPQGTRVLLVNGDPRPMPDDDEVGFVVRALNLGTGGRSGAFRTRVIDPGAASVSDIEWADVIVLANVNLGPGRLADRIVHSVAGGKGLLVTGGDRLRPARIEGVLGEILPARLELASTVHTPPGLFRPDVDQGGLGAAWPGLANVTFSRRHGLEPVMGRSTVEALFGDGLPAFVTGAYERGRVGVLAFPLDSDFGDLPYRPGYLPLIADLLRDLGGDRSEEPDSRIPGEPIDLERFTRLGPVDVITPSGRRLTLGGDAGGQLSDTAEAGIYRVERAGHEIPEAAINVQAPVSESDLTSSGPPELSSAVESRASPGMLRRPLAPLFFVLAGLLIALEGFARHAWLLRRAKTTRSTSP